VLPYPHHCRFPSRSPLFKLECLVAWEACIMSHTPLNMYAGHVRPVYPVHVCPYQWYGTLLQQISAAIPESVPFDTAKALFKLALLVAWKMYIMGHTPLSMKNVHYGSHTIEYAWRSCQTYFSCSFGSIPIIWNTAAVNKWCHIRITVIFHHRAPCSS